MSRGNERSRHDGTGWQELLERAAPVLTEAFEWIRNARTARADGDPPPAPAPPADRDRLIGELEELESAFTDAGAPGDDPRLALVRARLGGLYALRYLDEPHAPADRERGLRAMRAARAPGVLDETEEQLSARRLIGLLMLPAMLGGHDGTLDRLRQAFELVQYLASGDSALRADMAELRTLLNRFRGEVPEDVAVRMRFFDQLLDITSGGGAVAMERLTGLVREAERTDPYDPGVSMMSAGLSLMGGETPPDTVFDPAQLAGMMEHFPMAAATMEMFAPGVISPGDMDGLLRQLTEQPRDDADTLIAAMGRMSLGIRSADPDALAGAAELLAKGGRADDGRLARVSELFSPGLLSAATATGGSLADRDRLRDVLDSLLSPGAGHENAPDSRNIADLLLINRVLHHQLQVTEAHEARDIDRLEDLLDELLDLHQDGGDSDVLCMTSYLLGQVHMSLAILGGGTSSIRTACSYLEEAADRAGSVPPPLRPLLELGRLAGLGLSSMIDPDPVRLTEEIARARRVLAVPEMVAGQHARTRHLIAICLHTVHGTTGEPALLDERITELETARRELAAISVAETAQQVAWSLAEAYRQRGDTDRGDAAAAVTAAQESLRILAEDVLLQLGAEHGLEAARAAASRGLLAASWAAAGADIGPAVESLEAGRALVLRSAAASAGVAEQLVALGEPELAAQWTNAGPLLRRSTVSAPGPGEDGQSPLAAAEHLLQLGWDGDNAIPSTLRRRALDTLRRADGDGEPLRELLDGPGVAELGEGLRAAGADALVYLVPGQGTAEGLAVLVRPDADPVARWLPGLGTLGRLPLERYLDAGARRSAARNEDNAAWHRAHAHWEEALDGLADWAGAEVIGPVLAALEEPVGERGAGGSGGGERGVGADASATGADGSGAGADGSGAGADSTVPGGGERPRRLVLVPCGNLGAVPWHAARLPADAADATDATAGRPYRYLCERAVVSYAASGSEFLRSVRRERMPVAERAVLVADPGGELLWAQDEVASLYRAFYPGAVLLGCLDELDAAGTGTPEDVLDQLPGAGPGAEPPATLLHLAVHGTAAVRPTDSVLHCDSGDATGSDTDTESDSAAPHGTPGPGRLTVTRILDTPPGPPPASGPLIVLSACETDLSSRDHDEALTPTTALLARGAADVIGSRWEVPDSPASAALMVVLHHHLVTGRLAPPDALRAAQLWMIDPGRRPVPGLDGTLLAAVQRNPAGPEALTSWAAFIHQGNPAPTRGRTS